MYITLRYSSVFDQTLFTRRRMQSDCIPLCMSLNRVEGAQLRRFKEFGFTYQITSLLPASSSKSYRDRSGAVASHFRPRRDARPRAQVGASRQVPKRRHLRVPRRRLGRELLHRSQREIAGLWKHLLYIFATLRFMMLIKHCLL